MYWGVQSTLFNAICENGKAEAANFPFCTIEPNIGIVAVPDERLQVCFSSGTAEKLMWAPCQQLHVRQQGLAQTRHGVQVLSKLSKSKSTVSTTVEFVDIAGLVKGASKGEGMGNKFLGNIRECDAIVQVRCTQVVSTASWHHNRLVCCTQSSV